VNVFIGREKEVSEAIDVLGDIGEGLVWDVVGVHGIGKSALLEHVLAQAAELEQPKRPAILTVDMTSRGLDDSFRGDYGPNASAAVLWQTFVRSRELMLECADYFTEKLRCEDFDEFRQICALQGKRADAFIAEHDLRSDAAKPGATSVAEQAVKTRIRELQKAVDDAFLAAWKEFTARRRVLITLDPFDGVASNELGHWLVRLALQLPRTLTMVARVPSSIALAPGHPRMRQLELPYFTVDQVSIYLSKRFREEHLEPGVHQAVYDYTEGHPGGVELATKLIREKGSDIDARALRRILDRLPADPQQRWGTLVRFIVDAVHDPVLRKAVDAASVALSFDEPLLAALLGVDEVKTGAGDAVHALNVHRLIQPVRGGMRPNRYRLIEFIRLSLSDDVRSKHDTRWKLLHERAAAHYFTLLEQEEADFGGGTYGQWYRYERSEWQANKQDWLYHSGQLRERRELTRARFVLVFLEAFWWWGCYQKFDFNQRLLEDWERATATWAKAGDAAGEAVKDHRLAEALRFVLDNYPLGHDKPATAPWDEIAENLQLVQDLCGLGTGARLPKKAAERRQLARARAMIRIFLAHTSRFRDPADTEADDYYGQALNTFEKLQDDWVVAWLLFESADLALERGRAEEAAALVAKSAALTLEFTLAAEDEGEDDTDADDLDFDDEVSGEWDYELLANLHRARADAHWLAGEVDEAAVEYGRAVADAYWFQGRPHPPDRYTHRFYDEMTGRAAQRVLTLAHDDLGQAVRFATAVRKQLRGAAPTADPDAAVRSGKPSEVSAALFPRGPDPATELRDDTSSFMRDWRRSWERDRPNPAEQLPDLMGED
jgi:hypothetical protein